MGKKEGNRKKKKRKKIKLKVVGEREGEKEKGIVSRRPVEVGVITESNRRKSRKKERK